jgi:hypothetical protein
MTLMETQVYIRNSLDTPILATNAQVSYQMTVPLTTLSSTYGLAQKDQIIALVRMSNHRGWSDYSDDSTDMELMQVPPRKQRTGPVRINQGAVPNSWTPVLVVQVHLLSGDATGGSAITDYHLEYDSTGAGNWVAVTPQLSDPLGQFTITTFSQGDSYQFRSIGENIHGVDNTMYSDETTLLVATQPYQITPAIVTTIVGSDVVLTWTTPSDNGGEDILGYRVKMEEDSTDIPIPECSITVNTTTTCTIAMDTLVNRLPVASQVSGTLLKFKVQSINVIGFSVESDLNISGATVKVKPLAPTYAPTRNPSTTSDIIVADFGPYDGDDGGSPILSNILEVSIDDVWQPCVDDLIFTYQLKQAGSNIVCSITVTTPPAEGRYPIRWKVKNAFGTSDPSPTSELLGLPVKPTVTVTQLVNGDLNIQWTLPSDTGGDGIPITDVKVEIKDSTNTYVENNSLCDATNAHSSTTTT